MRSFIAVVACLIAFVSTSLAAPSVKLPPGFFVPDGTALNDVTLYHTIANSLNTLPHSADLSKVATLSTPGKSIVGTSGKQRASLVIVPEALAPKGSISVLSENAFPVYEMSSTLSSALVLAGASDELRGAFAPNSFRKIYTPYGMKASLLNNDLYVCGVKLTASQDDDSFILNDADFGMNEIDNILSAAAALCSEQSSEQVTVVDFRSTYSYVVSQYGADSKQARAVEKMINTLIEKLSGETLAFILATDSQFYQKQIFDEDFVAVSPSLTAALSTKFVRATSPNTGSFQIILWFTIFVVIVFIVITLLTCGVGIDIEKDTLLYQTTCLRGQPVF